VIDVRSTFMARDVTDKIPLAWILTRVQVTVRPVVVPGHTSVTRANTSPSKRISTVNEGVNLTFRNLKIDVGGGGDR
jgi:hypothetical protein